MNNVGGSETIAGLFLRARLGDVEAWFELGQDWGYQAARRIRRRFPQITATASIALSLALGFGAAVLADTVVLEEPLHRGVVFPEVPGVRGLGASMAALGDVNGDGLNDFAMSALRDSSSAFLVLGRKDFPDTFDVTQEAGVVKVVFPGRYLGGPGIVPAHDVDGDGLEDIFLIESFGTRGWLLYGQRDMPEALQALDIGQGVRGAVLAGPMGGRFTSLRDFNGDGRPDLVLANFSAVGKLSEQGMVTVLFCAPDWEGEVDIAARLAAGGGVRIIGSPNSGDGEGLGMAVADAGDVNGDGLSDLIIADPRYKGPQLVTVGRVHVLLGSPNYPPLLRIDELGERGVTIENADLEPISSISAVFGAADLNGDGLPECGFSVTDTAGMGRIYVLVGQPTLPQRISFNSLENLGSGFVLRPPAAAGKRFGRQLDGVRDEDGDGRDELLVVRQTGLTQTLRGGVPILTEAILEPLHEFIPPDPSAVSDENQVQAVAGDVNGDGFDDYLLAFSKYDDSLIDPRPDRVFLVFGGFERDLLSIGRVDPSVVPVGQSDMVTITGTGFAPGMEVYFSGVRGSPATLVDPHTLKVPTPVFDSVRSVDLTVVRPDGRQATQVSALRFESRRRFPVLSLADTVVFRAKAGSRIRPSTLGDVNGDGIDDYALRSRDNGSGSGVSYLVYGGTAWGAEVDEALLAERSVTFTNFAGGAPWLWRAADLDGDGRADHFAWEEGASECFAVFEPFAAPNTVDMQGLADYPGASRFYSESVSLTWLDAAGDFDGDGNDDLAVFGSPGLLFIVRGPIPRGEDIGLERDPRILQVLFEDRPVSQIGAIGDFNGDGRTDLMFSAAPQERALYIIFGHESAEHVIEFSSLLAEGRAYRIPYDITRFQNAIPQAAGDLNRDGFDDAIVRGQWSTGFTEVGVLFGRAQFGAPTTWEEEVSGSGGFSLIHDDVWQNFGSSVAALGAAAGRPSTLIIGSGKRTFIVGRPEPGVVYSIDSPEKIQGQVRINDLKQPLTVLEGFAPTDGLGENLSLLGDQDGDDLPELLIEAPFTEPDAVNTGGVTVLVSGGGLKRGPRIDYVRGDANADGKSDLSDAVFTLGFLFLGSEAPSCLDAADANDSGAIEISDAIFLLDFLFKGSHPPPPPFPSCGVDQTADDLPCVSFEPCR